MSYGNIWFRSLRTLDLAPSKANESVELVLFNEDSINGVSLNNKSVNESNVDVDIERRTVLEDILDNENFELGVQLGVMSIEDFETNSWVSAHFAYHITEFLFFISNLAKNLTFQIMTL